MSEVPPGERRAEFVGHQCCECVPRLLRQNKKSSDEWQQRTKDMQSDLEGLRHLMEEAMALHRRGFLGLSAYGQAALAVALKEADEAQEEIATLREKWHTARRASVARKTENERLSQIVAKLRNRISELEDEIAKQG